MFTHQFSFNQTAAHCVSGFNPQRISVRLLEHDRSDPNDTATITRNVIFLEYYKP